MTNLILQFAMFEIALFPILCITKRKSYIKGVQTGLPADFLANEKKRKFRREAVNSSDGVDIFYLR